jgi:hypothetical protein
VADPFSRSTLLTQMADPAVVWGSTTGSWSRLALTFGDDAGIAQLAEQLFCKQMVCL